MGVAPSIASKREDALFSEELDDSRWNHRAWVAQEILLSRRIIHYARNQMYFECQQGCYPESSNRTMSGELILSKQAIFDRVGRETTSANRLVSSSHNLRTLHALTYLTYDKVKDMLGMGIGLSYNQANHKFWDRVVMRYNIAELTAESDKMHAVLGLAKSFETRTGLTYCAGIWVQDIARHLFWCAGEEDAVNQPASGGTQYCLVSCP
jgi:hypothetical protein